MLLPLLLLLEEAAPVEETVQPSGARAPGRRGSESVTITATILAAVHQKAAVLVEVDQLSLVLEDP